MRFLKFVGVLILLLVCAVGAMLVLGSRLPQAHTVSATASVAASQQRVWQLIEDVDKQPTWRTGLKAVEPMAPQNGHRCWIEVQTQMRMPLCEDLSAPPSTRIVRIADPKLPFGGTWTYQVEAAGPDASRLTITENGTTGPAMWRFLGHYLFHEDSSIRQYQVDVQRAVLK